MAQINKICQVCGALGHSKFYCKERKRKPISHRGKQALIYEAFRDKVAIPYLDERYGHVCSFKGCNKTEGLDVDHIRPRGSNPHLKLEVTNLRYLCREHHSLRK